MPKLVSDKSVGREITVTFSDSEFRTILAALSFDSTEIAEQAEDRGYENLADDVGLFWALTDIYRGEASPVDDDADDVEAEGDE